MINLTVLLRYLVFWKILCHQLWYDVCRKCIVESIVVSEIMVAQMKKTTHHRRLHVFLLLVLMVSAVTLSSLLNSCMYNVHHFQSFYS